MSATTLSEPGTALAGVFARCREEGRAALIPYVTAGHPRLDATAEVLAMLAESGADAIELGVPFSDPLADGPTIQRSSYEAIRNGADLAWTLAELAHFREGHDTPVVLFTYLNPVLRFGLPRFLAEAEGAGAQALLLTDLPVGADAALEAQIDASPLDRIRLVAPTTGPERLRDIAAGARGFLYYVSRTGVTGARLEMSRTLAHEVAEVRRASSVPVAVGFGVATPAHAREVGALADGVVVGSALVERLGRDDLRAVAVYVRQLRDAVAEARR